MRKTRKEIVEKKINIPVGKIAGVGVYGSAVCAAHMVGRVFAQSGAPALVRVLGGGFVGGMISHVAVELCLKLWTDKGLDIPISMGSKIVEVEIDESDPESDASEESEHRDEDVVPSALDVDDRKGEDQIE